jgi:probable F420-dependent oxidoreductase
LPPTLTLQLPSGAAYGEALTRDWPRLLDLARHVEAVGADRLVVVDHVVMGENATQQYVWSDRTFPPSDSDFLEPLTSLAAIATATSTVRLSTRILIAPLRPAALLAKSMATLDVISGGRAELGVGTGWQREEYEAQGLDWSLRGRLLTDTIAACRALWTEQPCTFHSETVQLNAVTCAPLPLQPRLPVWFGGTLTQRNLQRVIELGDGWIPIMTAAPNDVSDGARQLRQAAKAAGRPSPDVQLPAPVARRQDGLPDIARTIEGIADAEARGATDVFFSVAEMVPDLDRLTEGVAELARRFKAATS